MSCDKYICSLFVYYCGSWEKVVGSESLELLMNAFLSLEYIGQWWKPNFTCIYIDMVSAGVSYTGVYLSITMDEKIAYAHYYILLYELRNFSWILYINK